METGQEPTKAAVKPSLLEQRALKLMETEGLSREDAVHRIAVEEGERRRTAVVDELTAKEPKILKPTCPGCGGDPLVIKGLRYEFGDHVVVEVLFCANPDCRIGIGAQIVGIEPPRR